MFYSNLNCFNFDWKWFVILIHFDTLCNSPQHQFSLKLFIVMCITIADKQLQFFKIKYLPVPMNMTAYLCRSSANTLSTTIRVSKAPLFTSSGPPVCGWTASSMRGRSLMNWRVLSGRSRERFMPILRATLLMHWNTKLEVRMVCISYFLALISRITSSLNKVFRLTAPGLGTGTSPVYITHFTWDVSTATGVLNLPSLKISRMEDTLYAHTADTSDKPLKQQQN